MNKKWCIDCEDYRPFREFYNDVRSSDGKGSICKSCFNKRRADNYRKHKEIGGIRYWNDRARSINARLKHKFQCQGQLTGEQLQEKYYKQSKKCFYCGVPLEPGDCHVDHINPISRGGENIIKNSVITCRVCNLMKNDQTLPEFRKRIQTILGNTEVIKKIILLNTVTRR